MFGCEVVGARRNPRMHHELGLARLDTLGELTGACRPPHVLVLGFHSDLYRLSQLVNREVAVA